jgi:DNA-binding CsgD family transcriptional regulator
VLGCGARILATLIRHTPVQPDPKELHTRFGLTKRQASVALLLAEGRSNEEIARALSISSHTARHHTEQVLAKLNAKSRAEVAPLIRSP